MQLWVKNKLEDLKISFESWEERFKEGKKYLKWYTKNKAKIGSWKDAISVYGAGLDYKYVTQNEGAPNKTRLAWFSRKSCEKWWRWFDSAREDHGVNKSIEKRRWRSVRKWKIIEAKLSEVGPQCWE